MLKFLQTIEHVRWITGWGVNVRPAGGRHRDGPHGVLGVAAGASGATPGGTALHPDVPERAHHGPLHQDHHAPTKWRINNTKLLGHVTNKNGGQDCYSYAPYKLVNLIVFF